MVKIMCYDEFTEEDLDLMLCEHDECPYTSCNYHRYAVDIFDRLKYEQEYPDVVIMFPKGLEEVDNCNMYLDI